MNKTKFIDNESSNNYEMFNTNYQDIRMESIILVTSRKLKRNALSTRSRRMLWRHFSAEEPFGY